LDYTVKETNMNNNVRLGVEAVLVIVLIIALFLYFSQQQELTDTQTLQTNAESTVAALAAANTALESDVADAQSAAEEQVDAVATAMADVEANAAQLADAQAAADAAAEAQAAAEAAAAEQADMAATAMADAEASSAQVEEAQAAAEAAAAAQAAAEAAAEAAAQQVADLQATIDAMNAATPEPDMEATAAASTTVSGFPADALSMELSSAFTLRPVDTRSGSLLWSNDVTTIRPKDYAHFVRQPNGRICLFSNFLGDKRGQLRIRSPIWPPWRLSFNHRIPEDSLSKHARLQPVG
jgi:hypothetical protein